LGQLTLAERAANAAVAYVAYLGRMFCPAGLAVFYPLSKESPPGLEVVAAVSLLLAISTAAFVLRRQCPYLFVGWFWYLGTLVPVIGLVQVGDQAMADRYTYLTQIGLSMAIAWGAAVAASAWPYCRGLFAAVGALALAGLMVCSWQQTRYWHDSVALWTHTLACTSQNAIAHVNLGSALGDQGQLDEAIEQYQQALRIKPDDVKARNNFGLVLAGRGQFEEAIAQYRQALAIKPDFAAAHNNLGLALDGCGRLDEAIAEYGSALEINPDYMEAHNNLGLAFVGCGKFDEAIDQYRQALAINPDEAESHYNLGLALARRGKVDEALEHYRKALDLAAARNNTALADVIRATMERSQ
jgi:tetratricopeptide (TPR) repeat protein